MKRREFVGAGAVGALSLGSFAGVFLSPETAQADEVTDLIRKADEIMRGETSAAVMSMKIKTKSFERSYEMVSWGDERGKADKALIKILGPASFRGFGTLKIGAQLKLYDPKTNHVQVVGQSLLGSSWMGSHFSNDDLVKETTLADHYTLKLLKKTSGKSSSGPATFYTVALFPKPTAPVAWGRIEYELWHNKAGTVPVSAAYFKRRGDKKASRTMQFSSVKKMAGRLVPAVMTMRVADKPGEYTKIEYRKLKLDVDIPASKFTEAELRR
jgi:outer membrane lipoprotein-sorting protein